MHHRHSFFPSSLTSPGLVPSARDNGGKASPFTCLPLLEPRGNSEGPLTSLASSRTSRRRDGSQGAGPTEYLSWVPCEMRGQFTSQSAGFPALVQTTVYRDADLSNLNLSPESPSLVTGQKAIRKSQKPFFYTLPLGSAIFKDHRCGAKNKNKNK